MHENDVKCVIQRALEVGCDRLLIVSGCLEECEDAYQISKLSDKYACTVGVHPCRVDEVEK